MAYCIGYPQTAVLASIHLPSLQSLQPLAFDQSLLILRTLPSEPLGPKSLTTHSPPRSLEKRASQALLSHVDLPPERGSDGPSTVNICCTPVSLSIVMLTAVTLPSPSPSSTGLHTQHGCGPLCMEFFVAMCHVCPIGSMRKNLKFYRIIYAV